MARAPIPTWFFVLVVVRHGDRFLLVHEAKHGKQWYLPAGRVEPGEPFAEAAIRETLEEAGVRPVIEGMLKVQHTPLPDGSCRVRLILLGRPADDRPPKSVPDAESLAADWFTIEEAERLPLRGEEALEILRAVAAGAPVAPFAVLGREGDPIV